MADNEDSASAAKCSYCRYREIRECRVAAGRKMLQILKHASIRPKKPNDPKAAPFQSVACHRNRGRSSIGNKMLKLPREIRSNHLLRRQQRQKGE
jgi:hypothetical protein